MRRLLGIALTLLIALSWAPAAVCVVRCGMAGSRSGMNMAGMRMAGTVESAPAISGTPSCCSGSSSTMRRESAPRPAWLAQVTTVAASTPPAQAGSVLVIVPRRSAVSSAYLHPSSAVSPPLSLRI